MITVLDYAMKIMNIHFPNFLCNEPMDQPAGNYISVRKDQRNSEISGVRRNKLILKLLCTTPKPTTHTPFPSKVHWPISDKPPLWRGSSGQLMSNSGGGENWWILSLLVRPCLWARGRKEGGRDSHPMSILEKISAWLGFWRRWG